MQIRSVVVIAALGLASFAHGQQAIQWRVEDGGNGHWYQVLLSPVIGNSWNSARSLAESLGGHLATFSSTAEWSFARTHCTATDTAGPVTGIMFLGGQLNGSVWSWVDGSPWLVPTPWWNGIDCGGGSPSPQGDGQTLQTFCRGTAWDDRGPEGGGNLDKALIEWSADCNGDGIVDYGQILDGTFEDANANGVPDPCEVDPCPGDITGGGQVNGVDLAAILGVWGTDGQGKLDCDINDDGTVDAQDLAIVLGGWGNCP